MPSRSIAWPSKDDIRRAVEELFDVKVVRVHTQNRKGKPRRTRFRSGYTKDWKKAIVKLRPRTSDQLLLERYSSAVALTRHRRWQA